jgi:chorismate-pyruvate lyase
MSSPSRYPIAASRLCGVGIMLFAAAPISGKDVAPWRDDCLARLEVANLLVDLNIELLKQRSATRVLESWCRAHAMATEPRIVADRVPGAAKPATAEQMQRLHVKDSSQLRYRSVALRCGEHVLSRADNWYVPERLSADMNRILETTDAPFGKVVAGLQPTRSTIEVQTLWSAMPAGWTCGRFDPSAETFPELEIPSELFQVRALLRGVDGLPFSEVNEVYQGALLNFTEPAREGSGADRLSGSATNATR